MNNTKGNTGLDLLITVGERIKGKEKGDLFNKCLNKLIHLTEDGLKDFLNGVKSTAVEVKKAVLKAIHADYKPIRDGVVIKPQERNRAEILNNQNKYVLGDNFKSKILPSLTGKKTAGEVIREDELLQRKTDAEICKEIGITEISADEIAERVIQRTKNIKVWTIIGYCNGFVVFANVLGDGRLRVYADDLDGWYGGYRLFSRDKDFVPEKV